MAEVKKDYEIYIFESDRHIYVGSAWGKPAATRIKAHLSGRGNAPALRDAIKAGVEFKQEVLTQAHGTHKQALQYEQDIIQMLVGWDKKLLNLRLNPTDNGGVTEEARQNMSVAAKKRWSDPTKAAEWSAIMRAGRTEESWSNSTILQKGRKLTPENAAKAKVAALGKKHSAEARERHRQAAIEQWKKRKGL